jgi:nucleotide-binding universal stress UspA family protein
MSTFNPSRNNILAGIDYSEFSTSVVEHALEVAKHHRPCSLHFLHVNQTRAEDEDGQEGRRLELLEWVAARLSDSDDAMTGITVNCHEATGEPSQVIVQTASEMAIDLVVVGTHGRTGLQRLIPGSLAEAVSRHAPCPVFVVRRQAHDQSLLELEPSCGLCVEARLQSRGNVLYCHDHAERRDRRYASYSQGLASNPRRPAPLPAR